ncbi:MAG: LuxR family transcriptional regulator [Frankia sp.]
MLDILGLDEVTYAVYREWLFGPSSTPEDIVETLGQPAAAVRRATERLVGMALLIPSRDQPGRLLAVPPDGVFDQLLAQQHEQLLRRHEQLLRRHEQIALARMQVSALVSDYTRDRQTGGEHIERLDGADAIRAHLVGLISRAERDIVTLRTEALVAPETVKETQPAELRALQRGVAMRGVFPPTTRTDDGVAAYAQEIVSHGFDLRIGDDLPMLDVIVVDEWLCLILVAAGSPDDGALLVRNHTVSRLAVALADQLWEGATPLPGVEAGLSSPGSAAGSDEDPTAAERELLRLLSLGAKDEAAARHLGVSVRTVRRMIADLMRELDARSRFQAGVVASRRGWL